MRAYLAWIWLLQFVFILVGGLSFLVIPRQMLSLATGWEGPAIPLPAIDHTRWVAAAALGLGLGNGLAVMREDHDFRGKMAFVFTVFWGLWAFVSWRTLTGDNYPQAPLAGVVSGFVLAVINLGFNRSLASLPISPVQGADDTRPPGLWVLWVLQTVLLGVFSAASLFIPEHLLELFLGVQPSVEGFFFVVDEVRLVGAWTVGVTLMSAVALGQFAGSAWREMARVFGWALSLQTLVVLIAYATGTYGLTGTLVLGTLSGLFAGANFYGAGTSARWADDSVFAQPRGWTPLDLVAGPMMAFQTLTTKRRASHLLGVGARGRFETEPAEAVPSSPFFTVGRAFEAHARFANLTELDDASLDVRGASFMLVDPDNGDRYDNCLNTGSFCPANNLWTFAMFVGSKFVPAFGSKFIVETQLQPREGGVAGLRRAPSSYLAVHYHSQRVTYWNDTLGVRHLVRYRLVPEDPEALESGLPSDEDAAQIWDRTRKSDETRSGNYLRQELAERLGEGRPATMRFQAQFHRPGPNEPLSWFDASVDWDEAEHPWLDIGKLHLDAPLPDAETERFQFNTGNAPAALGIPGAPSTTDPRSMADSEWRVMARLQKLRLRMYQLTGLPRFGNLSGN